MRDVVPVAVRVALVGALMLAACAGTARAASAEKALYSFRGGDDGAFPGDALLEDGDGNLFGTPRQGGGPHDVGTVFMLSPDLVETVLSRFQNGADGAYPSAGLIAGANGDLYGTAATGGVLNCFGTGCGVVFKLAPDGSRSVLYSFTGGTGGSFPRGLIADTDGNFYGTTESGGSNECSRGCGVVFRIAPNGTETVLHAFHGSDGAELRGRQGSLYGVTNACGANRKGTVFSIALKD